ncbi:MAG: metalloprotease [Caulobacteraceae bacterium]
MRVNRTAEGEAPRQSLMWAVISTALLAGFLWYLMGWIWALAGVVGVFVHEYGHVLVMNRLGCGPARIHIVPFLGGAAVPARAPDSEFKDVLISLAGPSFGLLAALPFFAAHTWTGDSIWLQGALFVCIINLINLAPAPPLDGSKALGPALARIHPMVERGALFVVAALFVGWALMRGSYIMAIFVGIASFATLRATHLRTPAAPLTNVQWGASVGLYVLVAAMCVGMMWLTTTRAGSGANPLTVVTRLLGV